MDVHGIMEQNKRKPNRLKGYDYSQNGAYFITICVKDKREILWSNTHSRIAYPQAAQRLSEYGVVIENAINNIPKHYPSVSVDKYVVMPNHIHMILLLNSPGDGRIYQIRDLVDMRAPTISTVINQMKGSVTKQIGVSLWQKLFHDHIIRNDEEYAKIWEYIDTNPLKWEDDCYYVL